MTSKYLRFSLLFLAFGVGYYVAVVSTPPAHAMKYMGAGVLNSPVVMYPCDAPGSVTTLQPYRVWADGCRMSVGDPPMGSGPSYRIELDNGRVVVFATMTTTPTDP